ncbi:MAG: membrane protein insertion efficiency factor YidD [Candidatus Cloacimonetes bacterium]|jgi:putative membrane protein insertion efficiency factor|nr:membrane protein insertion efficiency factor YidD [Candidatus Cloacimonadota bacterium]MCB5254278.1 membrane protein insertion efficiency factor YidD [Candidatus Cloacimonadota bacterium]MCK9178993.1 membrane protein insertion efficiency factor YidD [Candidatus Cloacimonadota bacterium]MCK9243307.1 membrane protein insertion efficiency factor YidD [Candidatus Cloacimonadota bacterium]MDD3533582.1 membrane protein insertion efficiency factor YidD [Candidatus Cloacimonadota bacterium]
MTLGSLISLPSKLIMLLIRFYQLVISPVLPRSCRFTPTCSTYAHQAFQRYSFLKALGISVLRILRCNPFCRGGYDPLP